MSKELYIATHEDLIEQYMLRHPDADWNAAYEATADGVWLTYTDKLADLVAAARQRAKDDAR